MEDVDYMETEDKIKIGIIATIIIIVVATIIAGSIISPKPSHSVKEDKKTEEEIKQPAEEVKTVQGTRTFEILATYESSDEASLYVTIRQPQKDEVATIKVTKEMIKEARRGDNFEIKFDYNPDVVDKTSLNSLLNNSTIVSITKTDKKGAEQVNDF